jgi:hypothetical protein
MTTRSRLPDERNPAPREGPLERLLEDIGRTIDVAGAVGQAQSLASSGALSENYLMDYTRACRALMDAGDARGAVVAARLSIAVLDQLAPSDRLSAALRDEVAQTWMDSVCEWSRQILLPPLVTHAIGAGEQWRKRAAGQHESQEVNALYAIARIWVVPIAEDRPPMHFLDSLRRWLTRSEEFIEQSGDDITVGLDCDDTVLSDVCHPIRALRRGERYLRQVLASPVRSLEMPAAQLLLVASRGLAILREPVDLSEVLDMAIGRLAGTDAGSPEDRLRLVADVLDAIVLDGQVVVSPRVRAAAHDLARGEVQRYAEMFVVDRSESTWPAARVRATLAFTRVCSYEDAATGRAALRHVWPHVWRQAQLRTRAYQIQLGLAFVGLPAFSDDVDNESPIESAYRVQSRAIEEGWSEEQLFRAILFLASTVAQDGHVAEALTLVRSISDQTDFASVNQTLVTFAEVAVYTNAAYHFLEAGETRLAVRTNCALLAPLLRLGEPDALLETLQILAQITDGVAEEDQAAIGVELMTGLHLYALAVDQATGDAGSSALQDLCRRAFELQTANRGDGAPLLATLQHAKGWRFTCASVQRNPYDARADPEAQHLLAEIASLQTSQETDATPPERYLDELTLVNPYSERLDHTGMTHSERLRNLERRFDSHVRRHGEPDGAPELVSVADLLATLPQETVLLSSYLAKGPDGNPAMWAVLLSCDGGFVSSQPLPEAVEIGGERAPGDRLPSLLTLSLREAVQMDPGPLSPVDRAAAPMLADGLEYLVGPASEQLSLLQSDGKRHLCIVPFGPLFVAPLHLFLSGGTPLAEQWCVTYAPDLHGIVADRSARRRAGRVVSVGASFSLRELDETPIIPEAVEEAAAVATAFGVEPLLDERFDKPAVVDALLTSRMVHIATHGRNNVEAPAFHCLYTGDGNKLHAYEVQALDLSGLELVTLSACETALSRTDLAGNIRGLPATLLQQGAEAVIGTLWPVESETSRNFFVSLYTELAAGVPRRDAFAHTQDTVRRHHPEYRDWGAFYFLGDFRDRTQDAE